MKDREIAAFVEDYRGALSSAMLDEVRFASNQIALGRWPEGVRRKGKARDLSARIRAACLTELHRFLCTDEKEYAVLRRRANGLSEHSLIAISAFIAGTLGVSIAVVSAIVGFIALAIAKIGINAFCRIASSHKSLDAAHRK